MRFSSACFSETFTAEDRIYGTDNDGYHLQEELALRKGRLKKIAEAKAATEMGD